MRAEHSIQSMPLFSLRAGGMSPKIQEQVTISAALPSSQSQCFFLMTDVFLNPFYSF